MPHADASTAAATASAVGGDGGERREGGKGHVGYLVVPCESVCASYVARQSTRRLRRVRGGLNINRRRALVSGARYLPAAPRPHRMRDTHR